MAIIQHFDSYDFTIDYCVKSPFFAYCMKLMSLDLPKAIIYKNNIMIDCDLCDEKCLRFGENHSKKHYN